MTAGIAHEFRNGLATIHGYARLLDLERLPPEFQQYVQGIRDETEALGQVVTNFLNFAKPTQLALARVDMAQPRRTRRGRNQGGRAGAIRLGLGPRRVRSASKATKSCCARR